MFKHTFNNNRIKCLSMPDADKKSRFHNKITSFILCQTMGYINFIIFLFHYTRDIDF